MRKGSTKKGSQNEFIATHQHAERLYSIWKGIKSRCYYPSNSAFSNYGGKGIEVNDKWRNEFRIFYHWALDHGYQEHLVLTRHDNTKDYIPDNCYWATRKSVNNRKNADNHIEINGEKKSIHQWAKECGVPVKYMVKRKEERITGIQLLKPLSTEEKMRPIKRLLTQEPSAKHLYDRWYQIKGRCYYQSDSGYHMYGAKGIGMCDEWKENFQVFYEWCMSHGYEKDKCLIRIDKKGNYEPSNCQWVTRSVSSKLTPKKAEKMLSINGEEKTLSQWAKQAGINVDYLNKRIKDGVTGEDLLKPKGVCAIFQGKEMPIRDIAKLTNIPYVTLYQRHKRGFKGEELLTRIQQKKR